MVMNLFKWFDKKNFVDFSWLKKAEFIELDEIDVGLSPAVLVEVHGRKDEIQSNAFSVLPAS